MIARNIETRIVKLEARRRHDDELFLLWRLPVQEILSALGDANRAGICQSQDLVLCIEWHGESVPPPPRWCRLFPSDLTEIELDYCFRELKRFETGQGEYSKGADHRLAHLSDSKLWHMALGVQT
jgi:hypothetical protein